jgi:hypothetical protein
LIVVRGHDDGAGLLGVQALEVSAAHELAVRVLHQQRACLALWVIDVERQVAKELVALLGDRARGGGQRAAHADDQSLVVRPVEVTHARIRWPQALQVLARRQVEHDDHRCPTGVAGPGDALTVRRERTMDISGNAAKALAGGGAARTGAAKDNSPAASQVAGIGLM